MRKRSCSPVRHRARSASPSISSASPRASGRSRLTLSLDRGSLASESCADVIGWARWVEKHHARVYGLFESRKYPRGLTASTFAHAVGAMGFPGDARRVFEEILHSGSPRDSTASGPSRISLAQYKVFEQRLEWLCGQLAAKDSPKGVPAKEKDQTGALRLLLLRESGGSPLRAWRRFFDFAGQGEVEHEDFVKGCRMIGGSAHMAAGILRRLSPFGRPIEFHALFPEESAQLESFAKVIFERFGRDLDRAWKFLDCNQLNWLDLRTFHDGAQKLGFAGTTWQVFDGLTSSHVKRILIDDFRYLSVFMWHRQDALAAGASGALREFVSWVHSAVGAPHVLLQNVGLLKGHSIGVQEFATYLAALGFRGDCVKVAKMLSSHAGGSSRGGISRDALLAGLEGRLVAGGHGSARRMQRVLSSPSLSSPSLSSPSLSRSFAWEELETDFARCSAERCQEQMPIFAPPAASARSGEESVELRFRAPLKMVNQCAFKDELHVCYLKLGLAYVHAPLLTTELHTGSDVAVTSGPPAAIRALKALPLDRIAVMGHTVARSSLALRSRSRYENRSHVTWRDDHAVLASPRCHTILASPHQPPKFKMFCFRGVKLRNGASGHAAMIDHVTFYRNGHPRRAASVSDHPYIAIFESPQEVDEFRFTTFNKDPGYDIVQWQLSGSNDGEVWRYVHIQSTDYLSHHGRVVRQWLTQGPSVLRVVVVEARGLGNVEASKQHGNPDPYCTLWVQGKPDTKVHTPPIRGTLSPKWNSRLEVLEFEPGNDLKIMVRDSNFGFAVKSSVKDKLMGQAVLPSKDLLPCGFDGWVPLEGGGRVLLRARSCRKVGQSSEEQRPPGVDDSHDFWLGDVHVL